MDSVLRAIRLKLESEISIFAVRLHPLQEDIFEGPRVASGETRRRLKQERT